MKFSSLLIAKSILLLLINSAHVSAQKKPRDIQEGNLFLAKPVKVDGKLIDWPDTTLQAFNRTTLIGYTIANDEKSVYLAVKSQDPITSARILSGGLSLSINTEGKKKEDESFRITFPVSKGTARVPGEKLKGMMDQRKQELSGGQKSFGRVKPAGKASKAADSALLERRRSQLAQFKEIGLSGFKEIPDSILSVYNLYGIKVAAGYDNQGNLIWEMAVPMKLLHISPGSSAEFAYNLKINGHPYAGKALSESRNADFKDRAGARQHSAYGGAEDRTRSYSSFSPSVDFWGKYSVATQK